MESGKTILTKSV